MRLTLLASSPRVAPGLLSRQAWQALEEADRVCAAAADEPLAAAVHAAGIAVEADDPRPEGVEAHSAVATDESFAESPARRARRLVDAARDTSVVWLGSADGDPGLSDAIAAEVSRLTEPPEVEVLVGSWDVAGARVLDAIAVMDRLRSPGGCPWDAEQTHESLLPYLHEEAAEVEEAVRGQGGEFDRVDLAEELGDVLLQVLFHARVASEDPVAPFDVDDVAGALVAKLVRRHPHVFAGAPAPDPQEVEATWARIKAEEKAARAARRAGR